MPNLLQIKRNRLILPHNDLLERTRDLYKKIDKSSKFRSAFIKNPTKFIATRIFRIKNLPETSTTDLSAKYSNDIMYSILANPKFASWSRKLEKKFLAKVKAAKKGSTPQDKAVLLALSRMDMRELRMDFARGLLELNDAETISKFISPIPPQKWPEPGDPDAPGPVAAAVALIIVFFVVVVVAIPALKAPGLNRQDVQRISDSLVAEMKKVAKKKKLQIGPNVIKRS